MGHLIFPGTGFHRHRTMQIKESGEICKSDGLGDVESEAGLLEEICAFRELRTLRRPERVVTSLMR